MAGRMRVLSQRSQNFSLGGKWTTNRKPRRGDWTINERIWWGDWTTNESARCRKYEQSASSLLQGGWKGEIYRSISLLGNRQGQQPLQTTKDKLEAYKRCIDFNELPQTFKDAVTVALEVHVQYLWIDSLCIIQDDSEDWVKESRKMEQVFSLAYCTISANFC